jgi:hypothetical protein
MIFIFIILTLHLQFFCCTVASVGLDDIAYFVHVALGFHRSIGGCPAKLRPALHLWRHVPLLYAHISFDFHAITITIICYFYIIMFQMYDTSDNRTEHQQCLFIRHIL